MSKSIDNTLIFLSGSKADATKTTTVLSQTVPNVKPGEILMATDGGIDTASRSTPKLYTTQNVGTIATPTYIVRPLSTSIYAGTSTPDTTMQNTTMDVGDIYIKYTAS